MDGIASDMLDAVREESIARQQLASSLLANFSYASQVEGFHLWLMLPTGWSAAEFASILRNKGVGVVSSAAFCTNDDPPEAVRVSLGGPQTHQDCSQSLRLIAETLRYPSHPDKTAL
jgi:hypothetical protein